MNISVADAFFYFECAWILLWIGVFLWLGFFARRVGRPRPPGYVGRFRRPDGSEVHVGRLPSGAFCEIKDRSIFASTTAELLANVTGKELVTWTKIADEPDVDTRGPFFRWLDRLRKDRTPSTH